MSRLKTIQFLSTPYFLNHIIKYNVFIKYFHCHIFNFNRFVLPLKYQTETNGLLYCRMMKLADMPSCLEGGDHRIKKIASSYTSNSEK